jgi:hypothetical protein
MKKEDQGTELMKQAAWGGHKAAQYMVAINALGRKDENECLRWIKTAARNNHAEAQLTYGVQYWSQQRNGHEHNIMQAILWIRKALEHGARPLPDPCGDTLSEKSFVNGLRMVAKLGRKLYLGSFQGEMLESTTGTSSDAMKVAAACGCVAAINLICPLNSNDQV